MTTILVASKTVLGVESVVAGQETLRYKIMQRKNY